MGAVIMTNSDTGGELIEDVLSDVAEAYGWPEIEDLPLASPSPHEAMKKYVGTYQFRSGAVCNVVQMNDRLYLQMSPQPPMPLTAMSETVYILQPLEGEVIFIMNSEGEVLGLLLRQDGAEQEADKVS